MRHQVLSLLPDRELCYKLQIYIYSSYIYNTNLYIPFTFSTYTLTYYDVVEFPLYVFWLNNNSVSKLGDTRSRECGLTGSCRLYCD